MLGRILVIKESKIIAEIYAHRGQVSSISIRRNADIEPSVGIRDFQIFLNFILKNYIFNFDNFFTFFKNFLNFFFLVFQLSEKIETLK